MLPALPLADNMLLPQSCDIGHQSLRARLKTKRAAMLFGYFIPFQVVLLPMARVLGIMGTAGTIPGLIFVHVIYGLGFKTLFYRNFCVSVPSELTKAAKVDGAGFFRIFWSIFLPISLPIIVVSMIWQFTKIWNDFLFGVSFS
ncbi:ABC transporter, permease protein, putative [Roseobacter denitrificans OCh 114]|uniref:ABC transporter, permease protein, putative n=1 Tax=Roseobacter denitrificans (strain ATCC 33942 / OCh 114) TaxID=375451 RepID=Q166I3_ROSDO|nr:ABC transporter, permease protein, putative [Roseobacter denitrificans OCh 114]